MGNAPESPVDTWMGHSVGHWEGETLVVDVSSFNDQTWFDSAGNFHSDELHVLEPIGYIQIDSCKAMLPGVFANHSQKLVKGLHIASPREDQR
jgi:hypothetical protein